MNRAEEIMDNSYFKSIKCDDTGEIFYVEICDEKYSCIPMSVIREICEITKPPYPVSPQLPIHRLLTKIYNKLNRYLIK